jgi:cytoskeleton protein RodZ
MQVDADSLGSYLRRERERRGMSLQDISAATKIQLKFLEALEHDDYDQLPPAPFVVGFLRAYAQCLSLEPEEIIATYHTRHNSSEAPEGPTPLVAYQVGCPTRSRAVGVSLCVVAGAIVVGLAWQFLIRQTPKGTARPVPSVVRESTPGRTDTIAEPPPVASRVAPARPVESVLPASQAPAAAVSEVKQEQRAGTSTSPVPAAPESPQSVAVERPPAESLLHPLTLQAVALGDTWLRIEIDGGKRQDVLLASGKTVLWEARDRFVMTIGNVRNIRLMLNGKELSLPSARHNVVRDFQVTRKLLD